MPTFGGLHRGSSPQDRGVEHEHEHWPAGHYRGRGNDQSNTGPSGQWLNGGPGRFLVHPEARSEDNPSVGTYPRERDFRSRGPKGYVRSDARIHEDVCEAFTEHGDLDASDIEVSVERGEVTLQGTVRSRHAKYLAESLAAGLRGVTDVLNQLKIEERYGSPSTETSNALYGSTVRESRT